MTISVWRREGVMPVENEKRSATEQGERLIEALTGIRRAIEAIGLTVVAVG